MTRPNNPPNAGQVIGAQVKWGTVGRCRVGYSKCGLGYTVGVGWAAVGVGWATVGVGLGDSRCRVGYSKRVG